MLAHRPGAGRVENSKRCPGTGWRACPALEALADAVRDARRVTNHAGKRRADAGSWAPRSAPRKPVDDDDVQRSHPGACWKVPAGAPARPGDGPSCAPRSSAGARTVAGGRRTAPTSDLA
ncbi:hypothetical protein ACU4GD_19845 [Cupriavidus basilensis]